MVATVHTVLGFLESVEAFESDAQAFAQLPAAANSSNSMTQWLMDLPAVNILSSWASRFFSSTISCLFFSKCSGVV